MASTEQEVPLGGMWSFAVMIMKMAHVLQGMNEHAIYDLVGAKHQRYVPLRLYRA